MKFSRNKHCFGRHQSFPLRSGWLTKGFQAFQSNPKVFDTDEAMIELGVGKNMVTAIRYWLQAAQIVVDKQPTKLGIKLFNSNNGYDIYLEDEATLWLIHWLIVSNAQEATTLFWFFNYFNKPEFESDEVLNALKLFLQHQDIQVSENTLYRDVTILLRMYAPVINKREQIEESLDSPLSELGLIQHEDKKYQSYPTERQFLPCEIIGFSLTQLFKAKNIKVLPLNNLLQSELGSMALNAAFRLTENALMAKLEQLVQTYPDYYELRETAGIAQIYQLNTVEADYFLDIYYQR